jgi:hypothetical protein
VLVRSDDATTDKMELSTEFAFFISLPELGLPSLMVD